MAKTFKVKARFVASEEASPVIAKVESRFQRFKQHESSLAQIAAIPA